MSVLPSVQKLIEECYACERAGEIGQAFQRAQAALEAAQASRHPETIAGALAAQSYIHNRLGHFERARSLAEQALTCSSTPSEAQATALRILGDCAHEQGDLHAAERYYHQAVDLSRQLGLTYNLHRCLHSLSACVYIPHGQFDLALAADEESIQLAEQAGLFTDLWLPMLTTSWLLWVTGRPERALQVAAAMQHCVTARSLGEGYYFSLRGDLAQDGEDPHACLDWYSRARQIAEVVGDPGLNVELRMGLSRYYRSIGNASIAHEWAADALNITYRAECRDLQGVALIERGRTSWELGDLLGALQDFQAAIQILAPMDAHYDLARAYLLLAGLLYQQSDDQAGAAWFEAASRIMRGAYDFLLDRERSLALPLLVTYLNSPTPEVASASAALLKRLTQVAPPPLRILTLGRFSVFLGKTVIPDNAWRRRAGELFRLLLISPNRTLSRDQVVEALWPQSLSSTATDLFHRATSALRRALEPDLPEKFPSRYLEVSQGSVSLHLPPASWVDYEAFLVCMDDKDWRAALEIYSGDLYPGDMYADWAVGLRQKLKQSAIRAALALAGECLEAEDNKIALAAARRAIEMEPWQEEAVLLGMQACVRLNDRISAVRMYQELQRDLNEELGIEPDAQVQRLYRSLL